ncbi:uncharacterized protein RHOBADRAFT_50391 [Rhodotorula graminis WP1]|uniref:Uncharacterized protein n=1 Tax=Rhodotorula graminis (strain WP1) TaxID=578459 RepID=A0A0N8PZB1_RHOGW|nr:uncharacterized protein RHOBADRAFT_50391 [Rhodotorula graminis WP1]KPV71829.1 hypothetical protein RHOBADRAFT_50391 [Rhodotorula graminis WP1]
MAVNWQGDGILWISNILIVNIAYAATLLLRLAAAKPGPIDHETKMLCAAVADVLLRVGAMRPTCRTLATLHGTRIRTLLLADLPKHSASTPSGALVTSPSSSTSTLPPVGHTSPYPAFSPTSASLLLPTQALLQAQEAAAAGLAPPVFPSTPSAAPGAADNAADNAAAAARGPNVFNLAPADSHALWNLFHEAPAVSLPLPASATMQSTLQPGTVDATTGTFRPDDWVYKSALDQDWLSSEPGAWAW